MLAVSTAAANRKRALKCLDELQPFSPVVYKLLSTLAADPDTISLSGISDLISKDTVLSGKVLGLANSALYGRGTDIVSVHRAVARLGVNKIRNTVLALSINRVWNTAKTPRYWSMLRFNLHSLATAVAADLLGIKLPTHYAEGAFVAGLFHDIGRLIMAVMLKDDYEDLCQLPESQVGLLRERERELVGFDHAGLSRDILNHWRLPVEIQTAVAFHEDPEQDDTRASSDRIPLSKIVHTADRYAISLGLSVDENGGTALEDPLQLLGTSENSLNLLPEFREAFDVIRNFL
jgi:HD-like signal output (HDOD) protein